MREMADIIIHKMDSRCFLQVGTEQIELSDYAIKSSANGITEFNVTIIGSTNIFEMSASLKEQMQWNQ